MKILRLLSSCAFLLLLNVTPCSAQTPGGGTIESPSNPEALPSPTLTKLEQKETGVPGKRTDQELRELERLRQERELQDAVLKWAQARFWIIALVVLLIGFFGVRALVRELIAGELKDAMRATAGAEAASEQARQATKRVQAEAEEYQTAVEKLRKTAGDVQSDLTSLRGLIEAEATNARKAAEIGLGGLQRQLDALSATVAEVMPGPKSGAEAVARQSEIKEESAVEQDDFARRSKFLVNVFGDHRYRQLVESLGAKGYKASLMPPVYLGIPPNLVLHTQDSDAVLGQIVDLIKQHTGKQPDLQPFPYRGIMVESGEIFFFPEGSDGLQGKFKLPFG